MGRLPLRLPGLGLQPGGVRQRRHPARSPRTAGIMMENPTQGLYCRHEQDSRVRAGRPHSEGRLVARSRRHSHQGALALGFILRPGRVHDWRGSACGTSHHSQLATFEGPRLFHGGEPEAVQSHGADQENRHPLPLHSAGFRTLGTFRFLSGREGSLQDNHSQAGSHRRVA